jgi:glycosyltransferase involved in cell wall biosynthesis
MIKSTIYIPCHNYARFLRQAVDSVLAQTQSDWEIILINDGSSDGTADIMQEYADRLPDRVRIVHNETAIGLIKNANIAIEMARGTYVMRLDADDWLDENALLVMCHILDQHSEFALVYPNYVYVDELGRPIAVEQRKRIGAEQHLHDLPAHGACTMVRRRVLKTVGGYDEAHDRQDGYDLWLKICNRYKVENISTPLFFYRQHGSSLSRDDEQLLEIRARIKQAHVTRLGGPVKPRIACIVGAKNSYEQLPNIVLGEIAGQPLINYTLSSVTEADCFDTVVVSTDDPVVVEYCKKSYPNILSRIRPGQLSDPRADDVSVVNESLAYLTNECDIHPDVVVLLSLHSPLRSARHIHKALNTLMLYNVDSVISISENHDLHYVHGNNGLEPLNPSMHRQIRTEREGLYTDNGAIRLMWADVVNANGILGQRVGHITMPHWEGVRVKSQRDAWLVEQILKARNDGRELYPEAWSNSDAKLKNISNGR